MIAVQFRGTSAPDGDAVVGRAVESRRGLYRSPGLNGQSRRWASCRSVQADAVLGAWILQPHPGWQPLTPTT
jgi:hypothetical protein